jgi:thioredoxin 2
VRREEGVETDMADVDLIRCQTCGATNRAPRAKLTEGLEPVCGRCKTPLSLLRTPVVVTDATFSADVERSPVPVLLDMWAEWCGPCRMIAPVIEELGREMEGRVRIAKMDVDKNPLTASRFNVRTIPTLLVLKAGREIDRIIGVQPKSEIVKRLQRAIDN